MKLLPAHLTLGRDFLTGQLAPGSRTTLPPRFNFIWQLPKHTVENSHPSQSTHSTSVLHPSWTCLSIGLHKVPMSPYLVAIAIHDFPSVPGPDNVTVWAPQVLYWCWCLFSKESLLFISSWHFAQFVICIILAAGWCWGRVCRLQCNLRGEAR